MRHILFCFTLIFLFTACSNDKKPAATIQKPKTESVTEKKVKQPAAKKKVNYRGRTKYNKGLQNRLKLTDEEVNQYHAIYTKYTALRKQLPKNDKEALTKWRKEKRAAFVELLGTKKYRQKLNYDKFLAKKRREAREKKKKQK